MRIRSAAIVLALSVGPAMPAPALARQSVPEVRGSAGGGSAVWMDPAWSNRTPLQPGQIERATVWFDRQLLGDGDSYVRATTTTYANAARRALRRTVIDSLKSISAAAWSRAAAAVARLEQQGVVARCRRYWIISGFTCDLPAGDPAPLAGVPGVHRVFRAFARPPAQGTPAAAVVIDAMDAAAAPYRPDTTRAPWNAQHLGVARVWGELGLTGRGVLHAIHDFGWTFAPPPIRATLWRNPREVPGNQRDDDGNGLIDDVHGFNFDHGNADLSGAGAPLPGGVTHGDLTAAVAAGRELADTAIVVGMAPGSQWAAVLSSLGPEPGVEWALSQGADTYSMSFSLAGLGELRAHWRKVMDHAALAGLFLVSGAGNFADESRPNFAPVPVQMRIPEDVPFSVFGVSGVGRDGRRPVFSSQGPVVWRTDAYNEGEVQKPDMATINTNILGLDQHGKASWLGQAGWSGNSFAGPHLAGVMALMLEADPDLTPWRARAILVATARDIEPAGVDYQTGAGVVDAYAAVRAVQQAKAERAGRLPGRSRLR